MEDDEEDRTESTNDENQDDEDKEDVRSQGTASPTPETDSAADDVPDDSPEDNSGGAQGEPTTNNSSDQTETTEENQAQVTSPRTQTQVITRERIKRLRKIVDQAAQKKKVFTIFGKYPSVRDALIARGWVQNYDLQKLSSNSRHFDTDVTVLARIKCGQDMDDEDMQLISRMLRDTPVHFIWIMGDSIDWKSLPKNTLVSRFPRVYFTTKVGLCSYLEEWHWFCETDVSRVNFPRCYTSDDLSAFVRDFRLTACLGLLRTLVQAINEGRTETLFSGKIPLSAVKFAVKRCSEYVAIMEHEDIDGETEEKVWDHQWDQFLTYYYQVVHHGETFSQATDTQIQAVYSCSKVAIQGISAYWPQLEMDGMCNTWLVKPGAKSRGRGIAVCNKLERIMARLGTSSSPLGEANPPASSARFVIQKYVERPLLIYDTKFDIRQWFLVTSAYPLTIWMYKESYLRFCSQLFSLSNLHESVHLTNNAVQCRYKNTPKRSKLLPDENMWDSYTFQAYLRSIGLAGMWEEVVYAGMRESITGALLAAQEHMEPRINSFELYGADFILTEDLRPWLIEINSSPAMSPTTSVTARMCPQCLEDAIKVVVDRRGRRDADTGMFELAYRQSASAPRPYTGVNLTIRGSRLSPRARAIPPAADGLTPRGHSPALQGAVAMLDEQLVNEHDLVINGTKPPMEEEKEEPKVEEKENKKEQPRRLRKPREKRKRENGFKKHSCAPTASQAQSNVRHPKRERVCKRAARLHPVNISVRRASADASGGEVGAWRRRVQKSRADCSAKVSRLGVESPARADVPLRRLSADPPPRDLASTVAAYAAAHRLVASYHGVTPSRDPSPRRDLLSDQSRTTLLPVVFRRPDSDCNNNKPPSKASSLVNLPAVVRQK